MPGSTPNYGWPYQLISDAPNGASLGHDGFIAADASLAAESAARSAADTTLTAAVSAAGKGRMGSYQDTSGATAQTAEKKLGSFTFTADATRRYRIDISGPQNNSATSAANTASLLRARWAAGATVTTSSTDVLEVQAVGYTGLTMHTAGSVEIAPGTFPTGQVTIGLFFQGVLINSGTSQYGNGAAQPSLIRCEDIGT